MPFTLCHPAIVLPLYRRNMYITSLPGLVIGSMAPDFVYFFSFGISGALTHTPLGILVFCVPAGLAVYLLYQSLIREAMLAWMPDQMSTRMRKPDHWPLRDLRSLGAVTGSLAIGAASHIAWDAFTHADTVIVNSHPIFTSLVTLGRYQIPLFKILQYLSSLVGFIVIARYFAVWFKRSLPGPRTGPSLTRKSKLLAFAGVSFVVLTSAAVVPLLRPAKSFEHGLFNVVVTGMAAAALTIVCLCLAFKVGERRNRR
jgi:hypothetical protein